MTAGALLRQARQAAGLTQREVAARAGVQQSVVSAYDSGGREPSLSSLIEACGVSLEVHLGEGLPSGEPAQARSGRSDAAWLGAGPRSWQWPLGTA